MDNPLKNTCRHIRRHKGRHTNAETIRIDTFGMGISNDADMDS